MVEEEINEYTIGKPIDIKERFKKLTMKKKPKKTSSIIADADLLSKDDDDK